MRKIIYLANPWSPHFLNEWLDHLEPDDEVEVWHCEPMNNPGASIKQRRLIPKSLCRMNNLRYFLAGIRLRFTAHDFLLHAHNSSGYGFCAFLSGSSYTLVTYGSEIYKITESRPNLLYRWLIKRIVQNAIAIVVTSSYMKEILVGDLNVKTERIYHYSAAIDMSMVDGEREMDSVKRQWGLDSYDRVWLSNRRLTPLYNIEKIVSAFLSCFRHSRTNVLVLLEGYGSPSYKEEIIRMIEGEQNIILVEGFIERRRLYDLIAVADIAVSIPSNDQVSASVVEAMAMSCQLILSDIPHYQDLKQLSIPIVWTGITEGELVLAFRKLENTGSDILKINQNKMASLARLRYSKESAIQHKRWLLNEFFNIWDE